MKTKKLNLIKIALLALIVSASTSCSKQVDKPKILDLSSKVLSAQALNQVILKISDRVKERELYRGKMVNGIKTNVVTEDPEMELLMEPLIENGEILHQEMVDFISVTEEFQQLSQEEKDEILYFDDSELATLSFTMSVQSQSSSVDWGRVRSCASFALGVAGIKSLFTDTLALGTVETALGALKLVGKRYLGYIGVALMIYDFADCLS
ncbi:hypothetical protein I5M32_16320 [Pedobacter sp. SD-b]|uniref:Antimicrobial peptide, SdpC family n=1 Tax=Pedobacter segetis TaxID=2793069 RepID=A0ABS1BNR1_9SPHI|nr:hypothetical protein [Pedobacter segetis]MBK0384528.1 hypothetical protein [Pedobacter segetis]